MVDSSNINIQLEEIKNLIRESKCELKNEIKKIKEEFLLQTTALKESVNSLNEKCNNLESRVNYLEKQSRKNNVIIYGLEQSNLKGLDLAKWAISKVSELLEIEILLSDISDVYYIGGNSQNPLVVILQSNFKKNELLRNGYKLKGKSIYINPDLSKKEREVRKVLTKKLKEAKTKGQPAYIKSNRLYISNKPFTYQQLVEAEHLDSENSDEDIIYENEIGVAGAAYSTATALSTRIEEPAFQITTRQKEDYHKKLRNKGNTEEPKKIGTKQRVAAGNITASTINEVNCEEKRPTGAIAKKK